MYQEKTILKRGLGWILKQKDYLFSISMKSDTGPVLPLVAFDICWAAFAILNARFRQSITLIQQGEKIYQEDKN